MFSFVGDVVLDPFSGTGTTSIASIATGRNSIGYEIDPHYIGIARRRISENTEALLSQAKLEVFDL
jgi:DNA modification methylase